jgi:hypothetical protein
VESLRDGGGTMVPPGVLGGPDIRHPAWVAWLTVHIYYLAGFRNRLAVLWSWSWNYLRRDRPIRIIARSDTDALTGFVEGMV